MLILIAVIGIIYIITCKDTSVNYYKAPTFPQSFEKRDHSIKPATQWLLYTEDEVGISIVGGASGLYGDGINTFEMWDYNEEEPQGYLSKLQINSHLYNNHKYKV